MTTEPRAWQVAACDAWLANSRRGVASVVTGAGKTLFAEMCMAETVRSGEAVDFVIVVPTLALLDQWYVSLREDLALPVSEIASFSGEDHAPKPARVNLAVINTARTVAPRLAAERPVALVVDECHRAGSPMNARALDGEHVATLGLSATPHREYDESFEEVIAPALGRVIFEYDYSDALRDGVISPFRLVNVGIDLTELEQADYDRLSKRVGILSSRRRSGEDVELQLKRALQQRAAVSNNASMRIPVAVRIVDESKGQRAIVFHERIAAAEEIGRLLERRGHRVARYHSHLDPALRRDNLSMFRRGRFDVLVTCRALDEGMNVPEASVAVIASSTASSRQRIQRLGRVLRPAPGKRESTVWTLFATEIEERRLANEAAGLEGANEIAWRRSSAQ